MGYAGRQIEDSILITRECGQVYAGHLPLRRLL